MSRSLFNRSMPLSMTAEDIDKMSLLLSTLIDPSKSCGIRVPWQRYIRARFQALDDIRLLLSKYAERVPCSYHIQANILSTPSIKAIMVYPALTGGPIKHITDPKFITQQVCWSCLSGVLEKSDYNDGIMRLQHQAENGALTQPSETFHTSYTSWDPKTCLYITRTPGTCDVSTESDSAGFDDDGASTPSITSCRRFLPSIGWMSPPESGGKPKECVSPESLGDWKLEAGVDDLKL